MVSSNDKKSNGFSLQQEKIQRQREADSRDQHNVDRLDDMTLQILRKYRKRFVGMSTVLYHFDFIFLS